MSVRKADPLLRGNFWVFCGLIDSRVDIMREKSEDTHSEEKLVEGQTWLTQLKRLIQGNLERNANSLPQAICTDLPVIFDNIRLASFLDNCWLKLDWYRRQISLFPSLAASTMAELVSFRTWALEEFFASELVKPAIRQIEPYVVKRGTAYYSWDILSPSHLNSLWSLDKGEKSQLVSPPFPLLALPCCSFEARG